MTITRKSSSIILTYPFLYSEKKLTKKKEAQNKESHNQHKTSAFVNFPKIENLMSYADRLLENNHGSALPILLDIKQMGIIKDRELYIKSGKKYFTLFLEEMKIFFFDNEIAFLHLKVTPEDMSLSDFYVVNKFLTTFYTKSSEDDYIHLGSKSPFQELEIKKETFDKDFADCKECKDETNITIRVLKKGEVEYVKLNIKNELLKQKIFKKYHITFNPHKEKAYPFNQDKNSKLKGRIGFSCDEEESIQELNHSFDKNKIKEKRHYLYFKNQYELIEENRKNDDKYDFIHYDTFITSLILEFLKPNKGIDYYDNFNPLATNYISSYITMTASPEFIQENYTNNFISFEPLLSSKTKIGKVINNPDYFKIYQSQADMFTIGNTHSIVHIIDNDIRFLKSNKEDKHYYTYLLSYLQRVFILNIINLSIINLTKGNTKWKTFTKLQQASNQFNEFLVNYNFQTISNSSSIDQSYQFFRKCNEVDKLSNQWNTISFKMSGLQSIAENILTPFGAIVGFAGIAIVLNLSSKLVEILIINPFSQGVNCLINLF